MGPEQGAATEGTHSTGGRLPGTLRRDFSSVWGGDGAEGAQKPPGQA